MNAVRLTAAAILIGSFSTAAHAQDFWPNSLTNLFTGNSPSITSGPGGCYGGSCYGNPAIPQTGTCPSNSVGQPGYPQPYYSSTVPSVPYSPTVPAYQQPQWNTQPARYRVQPVQPNRPLDWFQNRGQSTGNQYNWNRNYEQPLRFENPLFTNISQPSSVHWDTLPLTSNGATLN